MASHVSLAIEAGTASYVLLVTELTAEARGQASHASHVTDEH